MGPLRKFKKKPSKPAFMHIKQQSTNAAVNGIYSKLNRPVSLPVSKKAIPYYKLYYSKYKAIRLSYPTLLLWVAVLNTNTVKVIYARPKILAGHPVGNRGPKMARGPQFGNH